MSSGSSAERRPLRLLVYDATCPRLGLVWRIGAAVCRRLRNFDAVLGARGFAGALRWLAEAGAPQKLAEVQFWMHGEWGLIRIGDEVLDAAAFRPGHPHGPLLSALRERIAGPGSLLWFRTCQTFGARRGQRFARAGADFFGCRVAGHTFVVGAFQSGLHVLAPGSEPRWSADEGLGEGTADRPRRALPSGPRRPSTITFLRMKVPEGAAF